MAMIKLENRTRTPYHFPVIEERPTGNGDEWLPVERYRVVLGNSDDAQLDVEDPSEPGGTRRVPNEIEVPADAWDTEWSPHTEGPDGINRVVVFTPAPVVHLNVEQFTTEVFPKGSANRRTLDSLIARGDVRLEESAVNSIKRAEKRLHGGEEPTAEA